MASHTLPVELVPGISFSRAFTAEEHAIAARMETERHAVADQNRKDRRAAARMSPKFGTIEAGVVEGDADKDWDRIHVYAWAASRPALDELKAAYKASLPRCLVSFFYSQPDQDGGFHVSGTRNRDPLV